jgi:hypothetical protein
VILHVRTVAFHVCGKAIFWKLDERMKWREGWRRKNVKLRSPIRKITSTCRPAHVRIIYVFMS